MDQPRQREETIFEAARQWPPDQRTAFIIGACGEHAQLRQSVEALLRAHEKTGGFLDQPPPGLGPDQTAPLNTAPAEKAGDTIGRYRLLQQIGEGGCGIVYMAEQEQPLRRSVALKVIKLGMDTKQVIARFDAERQALALMDHPNIAKVLDAGATETGRPYFVMELVRGVKITDYCNQNHLATDERLELFIQVCRAVQHAHQKGIIHRDLKPSNILVTLHDGVPVPKVIDFGIAKATQGRLTDQTVFTAFEQFIGTPAYMSPEQAEMSGLDIDTRSDIYSLGVLLYELLTGQTPFEAKDLASAGLDEMRRIIREKDPPRPSTRLGTMLQVELTATAEHRHIEAPKLIQQLSGDLDWIVMKCLEKDRTRRYETANGLAVDIQRYLANEPVVARPPSKLYRFQKLVRRNKLAFSALAAVGAALGLGILASAWEAVRAKRAEAEQSRLRVQAETEAVKSRQVALFLEEMLTGIRPEVAKGRDTSLLREALDRTAARVVRDLTNQPLVAAQLLQTIAQTYEGIGEPVSAETLARNAVDLRRKHLGSEASELADSLMMLAVELYREGKSGEAEGPAREALAIRRKTFGNKHPSVARSLLMVGHVVANEGKLVEAEGLLRESVAIKRELPGDHDLELADGLNSLSGMLTLQGKLPEAGNVAREALAICRRRPLDGDLTMAHSLYNLANWAYEQGRLDEAEISFREALAIRRKYLGNEHYLTALTISGLASTLLRQGRFADAELLYRECVAIREKRVPDAWFTFYNRTQLGAALLGQKKYAQAEPLLLSGYEGMKQREGDIRDRHKVLAEALQSLIQLHEGTGQPDKAAGWRTKLSELDKAEAGATPAAAR